MKAKEDSNPLETLEPKEETTVNDNADHVYANEVDDSALPVLQFKRRDGYNLDI